MTWLLLGYWVMGNKQMFNNQTLDITHKAEPMPTYHNGLPWTENGPSLVMFWFLLIYLVIGCFGNRIFDWIRAKGWIHRTIDDVDVDEDLGNYFECIPHNLRKEWFTTEVYNRNMLGIHKFGMGTFEELRTV